MNLYVKYIVFRAKYDNFCQVTCKLSQFQLNNPLQFSIN